MPNFERYNKLHNEVMKRLEDGEITTESAKELNDKFFDRYIIETTEQNIQDKILKLRAECESITGRLLESLFDISDKMTYDDKAEYRKLKYRYDKFVSKLETIEFTNYNKFLSEYNNLHSDIAKFAKSIQSK